MAAQPPDRGLAKVIDELSRDPQKVDQLVGSYLVGFDLLEQLVSREITLGDRRHRDFRAAFLRLGDAVHGQRAYRWLVGAGLTPEDCSAIDVSGPLSSDVEQLAAFALQASLCGRAH